MTITIGVILYLVLALGGWVMIFLVFEFRVYQNLGKEYPHCTFRWVAKLYDRFDLGRIRW